MQLYFLQEINIQVPGPIDTRKKKLWKENQRKQEIQVIKVLDINHIPQGQKAGKWVETHHYHIRDRVRGHH